MKETPKQRAARERGELAAVLHCMYETTYDRDECHRRLDRSLDRLERMAKIGPDPASVSLGTFNLNS